MEIQDWNMMQRKLEYTARKFLMEAYGMELSIPVVINPRLKSTFGRFIHRIHGRKSVRIEMGKNYIAHYDWKNIYETLIHECIHHALYEKGLPHRDGEKTFEDELVKHGSHSTGTNRYRGKVVVYKCTHENCGTEFIRKRKLAKNRTYTCGRCDSRIQFVGEKIV